MYMEKTYVLLAVAVIIVVILDFVTRKIFSNNASSEIKKSNYRYYSKPYIMTERENKFFTTLNEIFGSKWYVVPQVHLSALLNYKVKGQNWKAAFRHINGKSVDFVLISKETNKTICAIELDDSTHNYKNRAERDAEVERMFAEAKIPLARFHNVDTISRQEIVSAVADAIKSVK